jgi:hypothetical protein
MTPLVAALPQCFRVCLRVDAIDIGNIYRSEEGIVAMRERIVYKMDGV